MDIIITNKRKEEILRSDLAKREHKCATGVYSVDSILNTISKIDFEYLIIEEEALENIYETDTWIKLADNVEPSKIYVLLNTQTMQTNQILLGTIINLGIYNFDTTPSKLLNLIRKPNALADVSRYREMIIFKNRQTKTEYDNTLLVDAEETNRRVQEYAAKNGIVLNSRVENYNNFAFKFIYGFIVFPLLSVCIGLLLFILNKNFIIPFANGDSYLSKSLTMDFFREIITPLNLIVFIVGCLVMLLINKVLWPFIKVRRTTYQKMMLMPNMIVLTLGAVFFYLTRGINTFADFNYDHLDLLNISLYLGFAFVSLDYLLHLIYLKMTTIEFEKDVVNFLRGFEKISMLVMILFHIVSGVYLLFIHDTASSLNKVFDKVLPGMTIVLIIITIICIFGTLKLDSQKKED